MSKQAITIRFSPEELYSLEQEARKRDVKLRAHIRDLVTMNLNDNSSEILPRFEKLEKSVSNLQDALADVSKMLFLQIGQLDSKEDREQIAQIEQWVDSHIRNREDV